MMKRISALAAIAIAASSVPVSAHEIAPPPAIEFEQTGVYVVSSDLAVSREFYVRLLGMEPVFENPVFIGFYIEGGLLGIASRARFAQDATIGGNVVPYIRVKDIDAAFAHVRAVAPDSLLSEEVIREGPIAIFKLRDPDGNMVEFYSFSSAGTNSESD